MPRRKTSAAEIRRRRATIPSIGKRACAVFVKLWALTPEVATRDAVAQIDRLDEWLLSCVDDQNDWFPSPYGGAVRIKTAEHAVETAHYLMRNLSKGRVAVSIGISWGRFERIYNVSQWNVTAPAVNVAARMASAVDLKGRILADPKVQRDAVAASAKFKNAFGPETSCQVKRTIFSYHIVTVKTSTSKARTRRSRTSARQDETFGADIVVFDIERYSEQTQPQQTSLVERLSRIVEDLLDSLEMRPDHFGPAGDGGYLVFDSQNGDSASRAWLFADALRVAALKEGISLRIGISNGPVLKTRYRAAAGGAVLRADQVSSKAPSGGMAATIDFWNSLDDRRKEGWKASRPEFDNSIVLLETGPLESGSGSAANDLQLAKKELTSLVHSTRRIVNRLYPPNERVRKVFTLVQESWTIFKNGDLQADRLFHIKSVQDRIFYWEITFAPEPEADPVNFVSELDFQVTDESGRDYEIVYLISRNDPWAKHLVLFFLPAIDPGETEPRKIRVTYRWPKYWTRLLTTGSELSSFSLRSPVNHLVRTYKIESGGGELMVRAEERIVGAETTRYGPDAEGFSGCTYEAKNYEGDILQMTLEVKGSKR